MASSSSTASSSTSTNAARCGSLPRTFRGSRGSRIAWSGSSPFPGPSSMPRKRRRRPGRPCDDRQSRGKWYRTGDAEKSSPVGTIDADNHLGRGRGSFRRRGCPVAAEPIGGCAGRCCSGADRHPLRAGLALGSRRLRQARQMARGALLAQLSRADCTGFGGVLVRLSASLDTDWPSQASSILAPVFKRPGSPPPRPDQVLTKLSMGKRGKFFLQDRGLDRNPPMTKKCRLGVSAFSLWSDCGNRASATAIFRANGIMIATDAW